MSSEFLPQSATSSRKDNRDRRISRSTFNGADQRHRDRREGFTDEERDWALQFLYQLDLPFTQLPDIFERILGMNHILGLKTRSRFTEAFVSGDISDCAGLEPGMENCLYALHIDTTNLHGTNLEYGVEGANKVVKLQADIVMKSIESGKKMKLDQLKQQVTEMGIILGHEAICVATGGDEITITSRDKKLIEIIYQILVNENSQNYQTEDGASLNFTISAVYPETERQHTVLSAAIFTESAYEREEVTRIEADEQAYQDLLEKARAWRIFQEYIKLPENQIRVLNLMAETNAMIDLSLDYIQKFNLEKKVINSCISPMLFTKKVLTFSGDEEVLIQNICKTNVIKSNELIEIVLELCKYTFSGDPKLKIPNAVGLNVGDGVLATTFEQMQSQFKPQELKYIISLMKGPITILGLMNRHHAKKLRGYNWDVYKQLEERFNINTQNPDTPPMELTDPIEMPVTQTWTDVKALVTIDRLSQLGVDCNLILAMLQSELNSQWCRDLIRILDTPENHIFLEGLINNLNIKGEVELKQIFTDYIKKVGEKLNFHEAIMMINRTRNYIDMMISVLIEDNQAPKLLKLITELRPLL